MLDRLFLSFLTAYCLLPAARRFSVSVVAAVAASGL
jgi:hypothetical protein